MATSLGKIIVGKKKSKQFVSAFECGNCGRSLKAIDDVCGCEKPIETKPQKKIKLTPRKDYVRAKPPKNSRIILDLTDDNDNKWKWKCTFKIALGIEFVKEFEGAGESIRDAITTVDDQYRAWLESQKGAKPNDAI